MNNPYVAGIDIGGQTTKIGIVDISGRVLSQAIIRTDTHTDVNLYIKELNESLLNLGREVGAIDRIKGIGVGAPSGNYYTGVIENAVNLRWAETKSIPFAQLLSSASGIPVTLTNDANAAAMGEMIYGAAKGMNNFIMITLGTGVGSGIVVNGKVLYGNDGFAGELGHTTAIKRNGRQCNCGRIGCLETYASAPGIARSARELLEMSTEPSALRNIEQDLTSKMVYEAAIEGDPIAKKVFEYTGKLLGESFADFISFSAPEAIILFGGVARAGEILYNPIVEHMNANLISIWKNKVKLLFSQLQEADAAILGASALAWDNK